MKLKRRGCPAIREVMFPKDTNPAHNIFGGVILSHIDVAGVVETKKICRHRFVTVNFKEVEFKKPVHVGDVLTCWVEITRIGKTSVSTHIWVDVERNGEYIPVTEGYVVYVAVDQDDKPLTIESGITPYGKRLRKRLAAAEAKAAREAASQPAVTCAAPSPTVETGSAPDLQTATTGSGAGSAKRTRRPGGGCCR
jgi:acyl-CoA thioesterase YciA